MTLTESDIPEWFGSKYAERGERYQRQQRVSDLREIDGELRALCQGSQPQPYTVRVTFEDDTYADSRCSCPIGGGCKHVAAVLYEYVRRSGDVPEETPLEDRLDDLPRDRLVGLVATYAQRHPDFESWVEARLAAEGGEQGSVDRADIRRRVEETVSREAKSQSHRHPASFEALDDLRETARTYIDTGAAQNAADILAPIAHCLIEHYNWFDHSRGRVTSTIANAASGLVAAFEVADAPSARSTILRELWEIWQWDSDYGGVLFGPSFHRAFLEMTEPSERQTLVDWARQALDEEGPRSEKTRYTSDWHRQRLGRLILDLEGESLSETEVLELVDRAAMEKWWIRELLERGEVERASESTAELSSSDQLRLVDDFVECGRDDIAEKILLRVNREGGERTDRRVRRELIEFYDERERWNDGLPHALEEFEDRPSRNSLQQVERLARNADRWEELETDLFNTLTDEAPEELIWYYLEDDDPDAAVAIWQSADIRPYRLDNAKFAEGIADSHPDIALELFDEAAESLIASRGRSNYRQACQSIAQMRDIYEATDRTGEWKRRRDQFLDEHSNLPAFKDEMDKAELI